jgi:hypothetical protein
MMKQNEFFIDGDGLGSTSQGSKSLRDVPFPSRRQVACREVAVGDLDYWS